MMLTQLAAVLLTRFQDVLIGRFVSVSRSAATRIAWRMIDLIAQTTVQPIVAVSFVTLSHLQDDAMRFRSAFCDARAGGIPDPAGDHRLRRAV
ncbi:MAG: oligosaccharide flippase family protein [Aliidongia sp.]